MICSACRWGRKIIGGAGADASGKAIGKKNPRRLAGRKSRRVAPIMLSVTSDRQVHFLKVNLTEESPLHFRFRLREVCRGPCRKRPPNRSGLFLRSALTFRARHFEAFFARAFGAAFGASGAPKIAATFAAAASATRTPRTAK